MKSKAQRALALTKDIGDIIDEMIPNIDDLDLQRLLKQIDADLMDLQHKISMAIRLSNEE